LRVAIEVLWSGRKKGGREKWPRGDQPWRERRGRFIGGENLAPIFRRGRIQRGNGKE